MTVADAVERLRRKAVDYELSSLAARERGDATAAVSFSVVALVLYEVADSLEGEE